MSFGSSVIVGNGAIIGLLFLLMTRAYLVAEALMVGAGRNALFRSVVSELPQAPELAEAHYLSDHWQGRAR